VTKQTGSNPDIAKEGERELQTAHALESDRSRSYKE